MTNYVALLRAVNVSGKNMISMAELKTMFEAMGFGQVQTYIQSGNVLFQSSDEEAPLRRRIEEQIQAVFGLTVTVVLRTVEEMEGVLQHCPFAPDHLAEGESLYVALLADHPSQEGIDRLMAFTSAIDEFRIVGREVYLLYRQPSHQSKLTNSLLEKRLGVAATSRNWRTITKLAELGKAMRV